MATRRFEDSAVARCVMEVYMAGDREAMQTGFRWQYAVLYLLLSGGGISSRADGTSGGNGS